MNHREILGRAWHMVTRYRALWIFGIILALTTSSASQMAMNGSSSGSTQSSSEDGDTTFSLQDPNMDEIRAEFQDGMDEFVRFFADGLSSEDQNLIITIAIISLVVFLVLIVVGRFLRYISESTLIQMVDGYEETGEQATSKMGWRMGWSRTAWRLFLIDLVIDLPVFIGFLLLFAIAAVPVLIGLNAGTTGLIVGIVGTIALASLIALLAFVVVILLSAIKPLIRRECVLNDNSIRTSISAGA